LTVRVVPRAGRTSIAGWRGDALLIRVAAAPVDGAANDSLIAFIAERLKCPKRDVSLVSGARSRDKRLQIAGLTDADLARRLEALAPQRER
jgi:uncharacterized protein (TIGR00251 family)